MFTEASPTYFFEFRIAFIIEQIIGVDKMMKYYFESDLFNLKKELLNYSDELSINRMFKYMDIILKYNGLNISQKKKNKDFVTVLAKEVNKYIDEIIINKLNYLTDIDKLNLLKAIKLCEYLNYIDGNLNIINNNKAIINENTNARIKTIYNELYNKIEIEELERKLLLQKIKPLDK